MMATLIVWPDKAGELKCRGCGGDVTTLAQEHAEMLRKLEAPEGLEVWSPAAFECKNCGVVLFEDELVEGERFVPPEFRQLSTS